MPLNRLAEFDPDTTPAQTGDNRLAEFDPDAPAAPAAKRPFNPNHYIEPREFGKIHAPTWGDRAIALANVPDQIASVGSQAMLKGIVGGADFVGLAPDWAVPAANEMTRAQAEETSKTLAPLSGSGIETAANLAGQAVPFLNPAGLVTGPLAIAGQGYVEARGAGMGRAGAAGVGALEGGVAAAVPVVGRTLVPAIAPLVRNAAGRVATRAAQGAVGGAVQGGANVAGTSTYDPVGATQMASELPEQALLFGAVGGGHAGINELAAARAASAPPRATPPVPFDPSADTQVMAPLPPEQAAPWQPHGPITAEPVGAVQFDPAMDQADRQAHLADAEARLQARNRIRSTGEPVVGPEETQENPVLQDEMDTQFIPGTEARTRVTSPGDLQHDDLKTQAEERPWPRAAEETPTFHTDVLPSEDRQGLAELDRMRAEAARSQAIHEAAVAESTPPPAPAPRGQPKVSAGARYPGLPARDLDLDTAQRAATAGGLKGGFYRDADNRIVYDPQRQPAAVPPPSAISQEPPRAQSLREPQGRPAAEGNAVEGRQDQVGQDIQRPQKAGPEAGNAVREVAPPITPAAPPEPLRPGARVRVDFKGQMVPGKIINRPEPGRWKVQADDGRVFPAMAEARIARDTSAPETVTPATSVPRGTSASVPIRPTKSAPPRLNAAGLRTQLDALPVNRKTPGLTDALMGFVGARAKSAGLTPDEWVGRRIARVEVGASRGSSLSQKTPEGVAAAEKHAAVVFLQDGRAIIKALEGENESSVLHELAHIFRRDLEGHDLAALEREYKVKNGVWNRAQEERFAREFERWVRDGIAPAPELKPIFQRFFHWLHDVYKSLDGSPLEGQISPVARRIFERLLTADKEARHVPKEVTAPTSAGPSSVPHVSEPARGKPDEQLAAAPETASPPEALPRPQPVGANLRPDLATPGINPEARAATVAARNEIPEIATRTRKSIRDQAQKRVDQDPEASLKHLTNLSAKGKSWDATDMASAQILLDRLGQDPARAADHARLVLAYQLAGNETAVAMGMRADRLQTPEGRQAEARDYVTMPTPGVSRKVEVLRRMLRDANKQLDALNQSDPVAAKIRNRVKKLEESIAKVEAQTAKRAARDKAHLKSMGFDLDAKDPEWARDPDRYQQFIAALDATKGGLPAVLREMYVGTAHMSGTVFGKKIVADTLSLPLKILARHFEAAFAGAKRAVGRGAENEASAGELAAMWHAVGPAVRKAAANSLRALTSEEFPKELMAPEDMYHYPAMRGIKGKVFRQVTLLPTVRAIDAFTRSLVAHVEVAGQAYRSAVDSAGKRLQDEELANHIRDQVEDFGSDSWGIAREEAMRSTFTEKPPEIIRRLNRLKYGTANTVTGKAIKTAANVLFPFTTIPTNIAVQGLSRWTPGFSEAITIMKALKRDPVTREWEYDGNKFNADVAQAALRYGAVSVFGALAASGFITGQDDKTNPLALNILGHHFSYRFLGPVGRAIGSAADVFGAHDEKKAGGAGERLAVGAIGKIKDGLYEEGQFGEMPLIRFASDVLRANRFHDGWTKFLADKTAVYEPSIVHQSFNAAQDEVRSKTSFGPKSTASLRERYLAYLKDRLTSNSGHAVKVEGHPLVKDSFDSLIGTVLWRVLSPLPLGNREAMDAKP